ncbi:trypsin-like serine protease [Clostridium botulinum]|uniref:trypsin-like serine protease n=1 Tax=Clostridium botulinum TaxID=1491 RepID=UPI003DA6B0C1
MEGIEDQINNINRCAIRISGEGGKDLYGSGILYIRESKESAFIFTAAHVIYEIFEKKQDVKKLHFTIRDGEYKCEIIELDCKIISDCKGKEQHGNIYIHENYDDKSYANDIAIICIPKKKWMDSLHTFRIKESKNDEEQQGYGFPQSTDQESVKKYQSELAGKMNLNGKVVNKDIGKYSFIYEKYVQEVDANRENIMKGYSGSGLFAEENSSYVLRGIVSSPCGEGPAGNVMWVSEATLLFEVMKQQNISPELPQSFVLYKNIIKEEYGLIYRNERDFFEYTADCLIKEHNLLPKKLYEKDFEKIRCDKERWNCDEYWKGQLKKAVILSGLKDIQVDDMKNPQISIPDSNENNIVKMKFLCTDDKFEKVITELIEKDYFTNGTIIDKTIFLWNGNDFSKNQFTRKQFQNVIPNIVETKFNEYTASELYKKFSNFLPPSKSFVQFDTIKGGLSNCNLALIGINRMMESLENADGNPEKMKSQFEKQIKKIWEG